MAGNAVLDLLFGKIMPSQPNGLSPQAANQTADGSGFADLLGLLSGITGDPTQTLFADKNGLPATDIFGTDDSAQETSESVLTMPMLGQESRVAAISALMPIMNPVAVTAEPASASIDNTTARGSVAFVQSDQLLQQSANTMLLPKEAVLPNPQVLALLNQVPMALPTGRFAVLSSKVTDGTLQMEVASQESPNQTIKLSLPTALLHQTNTPQSNSAVAAGIAGQTSAAARIPLADPFASTERFDQLLAKVNVKEIEISPSYINMAAKEASTQLTVALTAESNGLPITLAGRMGKNQITANAQRRTHVFESMVSKDQTNPNLAGIDVSTVMDSDSKSPVAVAAPSDNATLESLTGVFEKTEGVTGRTTGLESSMAVSKWTRQSRAASAVTIERPAVRMTLQQEMPNLSQLEGRTLMIKLEPEYLGTARLHLTMRQDTLSARVMVETPQAKAAVESSLSQLTDQLTKAGIKIDYIDVGVRGGGAQNQFFHKQSNWFRAQNPRIALSRDIEAISPDLAKATIARPMVSYVAADRVNIYA